MSTCRASKDADPTDTDVSPSTFGVPMSAVIRSPSKLSTLTPSRVPIGTGCVGSTRPSCARCRANTRIPLPHISESEPSELR